MYRKSDLARFLRVRQLLHEEGFTIAGARKVLLEGSDSPKGIGVDRDTLKDALRRVRELRAGIARFSAELAEE